MINNNGPGSNLHHDPEVGGKLLLGVSPRVSFTPGAGFTAGVISLPRAGFTSRTGLTPGAGM